MGLDIVVHQALELETEDIPENYDDYLEDRIYITENPGFPDQLGSMKPGVYKQRYREGYSFRAGSYGGYGCWRDMLCRMAHGISSTELLANPPKPKTLFESIPFQELICFSDCEGVIGTDVCKKLAEDFYKYINKAINFAKNEIAEEEEDEEAKHFLSLYFRWMHACQDASWDGCLIFS